MTTLGPSTRRAGALASLLCLLAAPWPASAHEYWLTPSAYRAAVGDTVTIRALVGTGFGGELKPYARSRVRRFERLDPERTDLAPLARNGDVTWVRFIARGPGGTLIAYESDFTRIELPAAEFDRYLELEGLEGPLAARRRLGAKAGPGRERYARCPKTWIACADPAAALTPRGLTLEIVPMADPLASGPFDVSVLFKGAPLAGALVRAWNQPLARGVTPMEAASRDSVGPTSEARTDRGGVAHLVVDRPGEWLVGVVHMVPSTVRTETDWESYWATFTFARDGKRR